MSWRSAAQERDYSGFTQSITDETGGMVIISSKGKTTPVLCQSEKQSSQLLNMVGSSFLSNQIMIIMFSFCIF